MLKAGIVGLPNVGKSTMFNAITRNRKAESANYPFCTIDPNVSIVEVPDSRLDKLAKISNSEKIIPASIELVDIAGLVAGASKGEGLGNKFLDNIRKVDAIIQVVRCFENKDIHHVEGSIDPIRDIETINTELLLSDISTIEKRIYKTQKLAKSNDKNAKIELEFLLKLNEHLGKGLSARSLECNKSEAEILKTLFLLTAKPTIFACNVDENKLADLNDGNLDKDPFVKQVKDYCLKQEQMEIICISASIEEELIELPKEEADEYLQELGVTSSGMDKLINSVFHLLGLQTYLTTGPKETRAWTIPQSSLAPQAAGVIHNDFERGFIAAEVISFEELLKYGSFAKAKDFGKVRLEGKSYTMQDGDVVEFRFNV